MRYRDIPLRMLLCLCLFSGGTDAFAQFEYLEASGDTPNPDRGFYQQVVVRDGFSVKPPANGRRLVRVYFVIDRFVSTDIDTESLDRLDESLAGFRAAGRQAIVRFAYHWPAAELLARGLDSQRAVTASPQQILRHINQLGVVLSKYPDVVSVVESGLIGYWGEQHGDEAYKQSAPFMRDVVDAWRKRLSLVSIPVLVRYPKALAAYLRADTKIVENAQVGLWNDCLGARDDLLVDGDFQGLRFDGIPVEGETCQLQARVDYSCEVMERYFRSISIDMLHEGFYAPVIEGWKKEGCYSRIERSIGYRFVIREAVWSRDRRTLTVRVDNVGWGKSFRHRKLYVDFESQTIDAHVDVASWKPGSSNVFSVVFPKRVSPETKLALRVDGGVVFSNQSGNNLY